MFKSGVYPRRPHTQTDKNIQELRFEWLWKGEQDHAAVHHATHPTQSKGFLWKVVFHRLFAFLNELQNYFQKALREIFKHFRLDDLSECLIEVDGRATFILWLAEDTGWLGGCGRLTNSLPGGIEAQKRLHVWFLVLPAHIFHIRPFHEVDPSSARAVKIVLGFAKIQQRKTGANKTFNTFRPVSLVST